MKLIDGLPTEASKNEIRSRLSVLDPVGYSRTKDKEDADAWATESAARSLPLREHKKARAKRLRELACEHAAAPDVALGLVRNDERSIEASASSHLQPPDETVCPGVKGLTPRQLRSLAGWLEKLDRELAEPPPADPTQSPPTADKG